MDCLVWNCQGAASKEFLRVLRDLLCVHRPKVLGLLEPRVWVIKLITFAGRLVLKVGFGWKQLDSVEEFGFFGRML